MHSGMLDRMFSMVFPYVDMVPGVMVQADPGVGADPGGNQ